MVRKNLKIKTIKTKKDKRRGVRKNRKACKKKLRFLGVNSAGLRSKLTSFKKVVLELRPSVFFIQETKFQDTGKLKLDNYIIYEYVRQKRDGGGGLALGCDKDLNPAWVREGNEMVEAISIEIYVKDIKIRCCNAYGSQENENVEKKEAFWKYLDEEVFEAKNSGAGFILHFDGNLWAGPEREHNYGLVL